MSTYKLYVEFNYRNPASFGYETPITSFIWTKALDLTKDPFHGMEITEGPFTFEFDAKKADIRSHFNYFLYLTPKFTEDQLTEEGLTSLAALHEDNGWSWSGTYNLSRAIELITTQKSKRHV